MTNTPKPATAPRRPRRPKPTDEGGRIINRGDQP